MEVFLMTSIEKILISRRYLVVDDSFVVDRKTQAWLNSYLFANFGIVVDRPEMLTSKMLKDIAEVYRLNVPKSYFANPQDTKFYTCEELFLEQIVSYFLAYGADESHVRLFAKDLPDYMVGTDMKFREFCILDREGAIATLEAISKDLAAYKRPWSFDEQLEFVELYQAGFYKDEFQVACGDNAVFMLDKDPTFARFLFKKDLVKLSVTRVGEKKELILDSATYNLIKKAIDTSDLLSMSMKFNQGVDVKFQADERNDDWTKTDASSALNEMMEKLFNGNPFQGVM
jgi:hypothetical protein